MFTTSDVSYNQDVLQHLLDIGSLLGTIMGTILNYSRDPHVHSYGSINKANAINSSKRAWGNLRRFRVLGLVDTQEFCI